MQDTEPAVAIITALLFGCGGIFFLLFYFVPTFIAVTRGHPNTAAIVALNILLGWSFLGWVAALVWSLTSFDRRAG
jgi:hypothetical protein